MPTTINTFTLYAHYAGLKEQAITRLKQLRSALFQNAGPFEEDAAYLEPVAIHESPYFALIANRSNRINELKTQLNSPTIKADELGPISEQIIKLESEAATMNTILNSYAKDHAASIEQYQDSAEQLQSLITSNDIYLSPDEKKEEYLFWLDSHTCNHLLNYPSSTAVDQNDRCFFRRSDIIKLEADQTDAVRISANHVTLDSIVVEDSRHYDIAHRDGIQLIPSPKIHEAIIDGKKTSTRLADQLAGTVLSDVVISQCEIRSEAGALQGIFASDGLFSNISIDRNQIRTRGIHSISLAGLLDRSHITNNVLHQINPDVEPAIRLYPLRIGGNTAEEGVVVILSFASNNQYSYDTPVYSGNIIIRPNGDEAPALLHDMRSCIPDDFEEFAVGLTNFDYDAYFLEYTSLSIGDFKAEYADEYSLMRDWLETRITEYTSLIPGNTNASTAPVIDEFDEFLAEGPTGHEAPNAHIAEKTEKVLPGLIDALETLNREAMDVNSAFWDTKLGSLHDSPIRNYVMKAIAIRHGDIAPFKNLTHAGNERRQVKLRFLLCASVNG